MFSISADIVANCKARRLDSFAGVENKDISSAVSQGYSRSNRNRRAFGEIR
jgi:hypothetical protein